MDVIKTNRGSERKDRFRLCLCLAFSVGVQGALNPKALKKLFSDFFRNFVHLPEECIDHVFVDLAPSGS